jgi:hypothetical protein
LKTKNQNLEAGIKPITSPRINHPLKDNLNIKQAPKMANQKLETMFSGIYFFYINT